MTSFTNYLSIAISFTLSLPLIGFAEAPVPESAQPVLSFDQAWERVQKQNPDLSAARFRIDSTESAISKAGMRPNPAMSLEAENFGGSGPNSGWNSAETTLMIQQPFETGGKRQARTSEAHAASELARVESDLCQLDLWLLLVERYAEALQAKAREAIAADNERLTKELSLLVAQRVQSGKTAPLEASRAAVEAELAGIERSKARRQTDLALRRLSVLWGQSQPDFATLKGNLEAVPEWPVSVSSADSRITAPDLNRSLKEQAVCQAAVNRERAQAYPDLTFSAGVRRFEDSEVIAWVGGISLPLPLFDRNRAGIRQARHELSRADQLRQAARLKQQIIREEYLVKAEDAWSEILALRDKVLPGARDAMEKARAGYEQGKFSYLEWLDAERSFISLRARWITALTDYHKTLAAISRLTGEPSPLTLFNQP